MRILICLLILFASTLRVLTAASAEDVQPDDGALEAASLKQAFQANLESLKVMDVIIETTRFRHEEGMRAFEESTLRERLVLDDAKGIGVFARIYEVRRSQPGNKSEPLITKAVVAQRVGNHVGERTFPEPGTWLAIQGEQTFETAANYPDFRFIGRYAYPMPAGSFPATVAESLLKAGLSALQGTKVEYMPGQTALITYRYSRDPSELRITHKEFDLSKNLLVSMRVHRQLTDSQEVIPQILERYQWKQAGDFYVPSAIESEQRKQGRGPDGKPIVWIEHSDASFRWLAVNTEIDATKVGDGLLSDLNAVLAFVEAKGEHDISTPLASGRPASSR
jgi:hypothetical protein